MEESEDDGNYIANLKAVINGMVTTAPDPLSRRQVQQILHDYARDLYVQFWANDNDDNSFPEEALEEALDTFDFLYKHEGWPE